ncbi:GntR family transcriptional regulator [Bacillus thuringiensis]|uniref:GntR family transcriptional regulator n=1 Tax=Bacillus thuringiensis TaxID=1428 RepID=UPI000BF7D35E|nr:GntR family transcriptional regulator [Bacillus thuringiensis]PEV87118.1 GntR family transcriptional regulator [Bacillus thuringiensis]
MPIPKNLNKQTRFSAKTIVLNQLQDWIIEGVLRPNEKINDTELAQALGVSRTPVREALQILELSGLVEMVPGQKTKISPINVADVPLIYETIASIHTLAGKQAINNIKTSDIKALTLINKEFKQAIEKMDTRNALTLDLKFHNLIVEISKNTYIEPFLENLHLHALRLEYIFFQNVIHDSRSIDEHTNIIKALEIGDSSLLENTMSNNWLRPMKDVQNILASKNL